VTWRLQASRPDRRGHISAWRGDTRGRYLARGTVK